MRIVVACDGLFDGGLDNNAVASIVRNSSGSTEAARALVRQALHFGSTDNITCVVVFVDEPARAEVAC